ncbi:DUF302 domain-containing protein [Vibrio astriarenae]
MKLITHIIALSFLLMSSAYADNGLITIKSHHGVDATVERLENVLDERGMTIFARIDHTKAAEDVGIDLRPTQLLIFGNPMVGSKLMMCAQSAGIDLPLKALVSQDEQGDVWFSYNAPSYLADRHQAQGCDRLVENMSKAMASFAQLATQP